MDKKELLRTLNEDLSLEYRSVIQYIQHISSVKGAEYQQILKELSHHLQQEVEHATTLARQIDFLGGVPTNEVAAFETETEAEQALAQDLSLEEEQLKRYRRRVQQADDLGLPDLSEALAPLLEQTQDHVRELRAVVGK
jgi:bacterioferritin